MVVLLVFFLLLPSIVQGKCLLEDKCHTSCEKFVHKVVNSSGDLTLYEYECKDGGSLWIDDWGKSGWASSTHITAVICNTSTGVWQKVDSRLNSRNYAKLKQKDVIQCDSYPPLYVILPIVFIIIVLIFVILLCIIVGLPLRRRYIRYSQSQTKTERASFGFPKAPCSKARTRTRTPHVAPQTPAAPVEMAGPTPLATTPMAVGPTDGVIATPLTPATPIEEGTGVAPTPVARTPALAPVTPSEGVVAPSGPATPVSPFEGPPTPTPVQVSATPTPVQGEKQAKSVTNTTTKTGEDTEKKQKTGKEKS